jgi:hypothetical protein
MDTTDKAIFKVMVVFCIRQSYSPLNTKSCNSYRMMQCLHCQSACINRPIQKKEFNPNNESSEVFWDVLDLWDIRSFCRSESAWCLNLFTSGTLLLSRIRDLCLWGEIKGGENIL